MTTQEYVSVEQFAARTSLSTRSIWKLLQEKRLPSLRVGGRRLLPVDEAMEAIRGLGVEEVGAPSAKGQSTPPVRNLQAALTSKDRYGEDSS